MSLPLSELLFAYEGICEDLGGEGVVFLGDFGLLIQRLVGCRERGIGLL